MRTDAHDLACVRDPAIELLLSHAATLTDQWCSRRRARRQLQRTPDRRHTDVPIWRSRCVDRWSVRCSCSGASLIGVDEGDVVSTSSARERLRRQRMRLRDGQRIGCGTAARCPTTTPSRRAASDHARNRRRCSATSEHTVSISQNRARCSCATRFHSAGVRTNDAFQHYRATHPELLPQQRGLQLVAELTDGLDAAAIIGLKRNTTCHEHIHERVAESTTASGHVVVCFEWFAGPLQPGNRNRVHDPTVDQPSLSVGRVSAGIARVRAWRGNVSQRGPLHHASPCHRIRSRARPRSGHS